MNNTEALERMKSIKALTIVRHFIKCKRGDKCPWGICAKATQVVKKRTVDGFLSSPVSTHYNKCRATNESTLSLLRQGRRRQSCLCAFAKEKMKKLKEDKFPDSPMSLQIAVLSQKKRTA